MAKKRRVRAASPAISLKQVDVVIGRVEKRVRALRVTAERQKEKERVLRFLGGLRALLRGACDPEDESGFFPYRL